MSWAAARGELSLAPLLFTMILNRDGLALGSASTLTHHVTLNKCSLSVWGLGGGHLGRWPHSCEAQRSPLCPL